MKEQVVPQDILDDAEKLFPKPNRADYHTDTEHEYALLVFRSANRSMYDGYIKGRVDERTRLEERVAILRTWMSENRPQIAGLGAVKSLLDNLLVGELPKGTTIRKL